MLPYNSRIKIIKNLFSDRVNIAIKFASINNGSIVLDVGCNTGFVLEEIRNLNYFSEYYGIDMVDKFPTTVIEKSNFRVADTRNLPFDNDYFDVVFAMDTLEHIKEYEVAINEIWRVLKPDGIAVLSGPTESLFYKFCRWLWIRTWSEASHICTVYDLEKKFESKGFQLISHESLPKWPVPELFRICKFKKMPKDNN